MKTAIDEPTPFERVRQGLEECLQFVRGERKLRTFVVVKAPPPWNAAAVQRFRRSRGMTQGQFASLLNVSLGQCRVGSKANADLHRRLSDCSNF